MKSLKLITQIAPLALALQSSSAADQRLYLLTGPPVVGVSGPVVALLRINGAGQGVTLVRTLFDGQRSTGHLCSVGVNSQDRLITMVDDEYSEAWTNVVDMDKPLGIGRLSMAYGTAPGRTKGCLDGFLARSPDGRLLQVVELTGDFALREALSAGPDVSGFSLTGVQLRPFVSEPNIEHLPWQYRARVEVSTVGWEQGLSGYGLPEISADESGALSVLTLGPAPLSRSLDKRVADQVRQNPEGAFRLEVSNSHWLVLLRTRSKKSVPSGVGASFHDVLDKGTGDWQTFEVPGSESVLKNFGDWLAGTVVEGNSTRESPGRTRRMSIDGGTGRIRFPIDSEWADLKQYSPGLLYLLNARTHQTFTIQTGDGDSEILLIENGTLYYRVNDSIFSAAIGPENVGTPVLLATDARIPDVHWAFLGPSGPVEPVKR